MNISPLKELNQFKQVYSIYKNPVLSSPFFAGKMDEWIKNKKNTDFRSQVEAVKAKMQTEEMQTLMNTVAFEKASITYRDILVNMLEKFIKKEYSSSNFYSLVKEDVIPFNDEKLAEEREAINSAMDIFAEKGLIKSSEPLSPLFEFFWPHTPAWEMDETTYIGLKELFCKNSKESFCQNQ